MKTWKMGTFALVLALAAGIAGASLKSVMADEKQPHMRKALLLLQEAKDQLEKASHDKGGHRAKALEHVREAIEHVRKGIAFDERT